MDAGVFARMDCDGDGGISPRDLRIAMRTLGLSFTAEETEALVRSVDANNTGKIDFEQFAAVIQEQVAARDEVEQLQLAFDAMDVDGTGKISFANLKAIARELQEEVTDEELYEVINEADRDDDGELNFDEFVSLVKTSKSGEAKRRATFVPPVQSGVRKP